MVCSLDLVISSLLVGGGVRCNEIAVKQHQVAQGAKHAASDSRQVSSEFQADRETVQTQCKDTSTIKQTLGVINMVYPSKGSEMVRTKCKSQLPMNTNLFRRDIR